MLVARRGRQKEEREVERGNRKELEAGAGLGSNCSKKSNSSNNMNNSTSN